MLAKIFSLIVAPILVGLAIELFSHWLEGKDKEDD
ncbi:type I toxin-antitoxin system Fst family toxin [Tetragenococcus halophilus]|uniref:Type I toxin-antitoxin system Fst family toxin n=1 Tax=Tetragenococcus halophilus TaxID=51669 RepID=A0AB35HS94_TETHA|nr:type I toxin-antitoxin system Fst family toxin [Tetragenococcus halophilus]MDN6185033.1 type I toxin-antitoxin system Fst family toxin [Lactococcus lactis]MDN6497881.1 type I toxin-antitoxin system Fst family toxin [Tetragenococcus koreensis]MDN6640938.1 type I toxin-antitoxin system Fst family toxin [Tetragenococcus sp.]MCF1602270.1 type I toxin-antitoxin system Fst family toxin [Tetragenococcus halophilus]MCO7026993.1 type I toxin-antitoxin system Fst family toxin [Tetragenococcus halophi